MYLCDIVLSPEIQLTVCIGCSLPLACQQRRVELNEEPLRRILAHPTTHALQRVVVTCKAFLCAARLTPAELLPHFGQPPACCVGVRARVTFKTPVCFARSDAVPLARRRQRQHLSSHRAPFQFRLLRPTNSILRSPLRVPGWQSIVPVLLL